MKKIFIALLLAMSFIPMAEAGVCNKGSLAGQYRYQFFGRVGTMTFNGKGGFTLAGFVLNSNGTAKVPVTGSGTYVVSVGCVATLKPTKGNVLEIYLDDMNNVPATRFAYHGTMMGGTLTRIFGK
jgi:hypothetical protein